ncbi:Nucleoside-diphosphate-sugar epimerase [Phyllobacterium sp. YR620]|uniref:SDR family oxidoreductase n=1 Tax=unclassified Phyllobacterium TaxID=2638441 RepID=UPI00088D0266|nr:MULTISPECIES: SDR family oxidoreductase [unclassified Phyllobacterium]SDP34990.1 Nucleoside-diphosphate-sugar epimerase [Phyllobacterium sp. YR620]SFI72246.1 Nucleoside-diphosphate-sugar epimerase [Phyllobacterium sp. CL33Tsu]
MQIFLFGAGYSARAFARIMAGQADFIGGTTRDASKFAALKQDGITPYLFHGTHASQEIVDTLASVTHIAVSTSPGQSGDPVLAQFAPTIARGMPKLQWIGYLSTVGVYGNHGGAWVDETTPCHPVSARSVERVDAEKGWQELANRREVPLAILRLSGIYGPGRNAFVNLSNGTARRLNKTGQVFNRIHVDDIAGALRFLATRNEGGIFNITDDEPAPPQDVVAYAAELMGVEPPEESDFETAPLTPMARSFYGENKRVSNARIKALGYTFRYPDYGTAFSAMWRGDSWR